MKVNTQKHKSSIVHIENFCVNFSEKKKLWKELVSLLSFKYFHFFEEASINKLKLCNLVLASSFSTLGINDSPSSKSRKQRNTDNSLV
jgi:hypothetical protein